MGDRVWQRVAPDEKDQHVGLIQLEKGQWRRHHFSSLATLRLLQSSQPAGWEVRHSIRERVNNGKRARRPGGPSREQSTVLRASGS